MTARIPFKERGGALRGLLDLATGCYPAFLFGGSCKAALPVFHFHDVTEAWLEPRLQYLAENRYRSVTCDEIARLVIDGVSLRQLVSPGSHLSQQPWQTDESISRVRTKGDRKETVAKELPKHCDTMA